MSRMAHYRIFGYVVTLAMHIGNTISSRIVMRGEIMEDPELKNMASMESYYYTIWNIAFQMLYATLGLYCDVKSLNKDFQDKTLSTYSYYRCYFFGTIVWPSTLFVFTFFWPIFLYDRNLLFPEFIDKAFPKSFNFILHGAILPVVLWEMIFLPRTIPKHHNKNLIWLNLIYVVYIAWIFFGKATKGLWPYPILAYTEGTIYFLSFFLVVYLLLYIHYYTQWILVRYIWGNIQDIKSS